MKYLKLIIVSFAGYNVNHYFSRIVRIAIVKLGGFILCNFRVKYWSYFTFYVTLGKFYFRKCRLEKVVNCYSGIFDPKRFINIPNFGVASIFIVVYFLYYIRFSRLQYNYMIGSFESFFQFFRIPIDYRPGSIMHREYIFGSQKSSSNCSLFRRHGKESSNG